MKICSYHPFPKSLSQERDLVAALLILNCISSKSMSLNQAPVSARDLLSAGNDRSLVSETDRQSFALYTA